MSDPFLLENLRCFQRLDLNYVFRKPDSILIPKCLIMIKTIYLQAYKYIQ